MLAYRYRLRVLIAGTVAAGLIAFLIGGLGSFGVALNCAYMGGLTGSVKRKGWGTPTVIVSSLIAAVTFAAGVVGLLAMLTRLRHLIFEVMTANVDCVTAFLARVHLEGGRRRGEAVLRRYTLHYWPLLILGWVVCAILSGSLIGWWALSRLLERMRDIPPTSSSTSRTTAVP